VSDRADVSRRHTGRVVSGGNVDLLRHLVALWNEAKLEPPLDVIDPEIEVLTPFSTLTGEPYRGLSGYRQWRADITEQFERWEMNLSEIRDLGDQRLLAVGVARIRGRGSGMELDQPAAGVLDFRAGRLLRVRIYLSETEALQAAGLGA
jgi:ketosteroid isomerase-like protein